MSGRGLAHTHSEAGRERLILSAAGSFDTRGKPGIQRRARWWGLIRPCAPNPTRRRQFWVQTVPQLTARQREELEFDAGARLGSYLPNNAFLVTGDCGMAVSFARARHVVWVGERPAQYKMPRELWSFNASGFAHSQIELYVALMPAEQRAGASAAFLAEEYASLLQVSLLGTVKAKAVSDDKLALQVAARDVLNAAILIGSQPETVWVEEKVLLASRNFASNKIVVSGLSEEVRGYTTNLLNEPDVGLNGSGVVMAVSDTGLDFDHCMLWQEPFPFPCFDPLDVSVAGLNDCPASIYAGLLANPDFEAFITMQLEAREDRPLLDSGRTAGASTLKAPLDLLFPDRAVRLASGLRFDMRNKTTTGLLLEAWREVRPYLLQQQVAMGPKLCDGCGGTMAYVNGTEYMIPSSPYTYSNKDRTNEIFDTKDMRNKWRRLQNLMFEKCFCFFTVGSPATINQLEKWQGPVPPIREFQALALTPNSAISRKGDRLPAMDEVMMANMCNITRGGGKWPKPRPVRDPDGVLVDMCQYVSFDWGDETIVWNTCELEWDARRFEDSIAKCFASDYLPKPKGELLRDPAGYVQSQQDAAAALELINPIEQASILQNLRNSMAPVYTYNTTMAWWKEYTRVPAFDYHDKSRRVVNSYFVMQGCEPCGMCARLRLDSRDYPGISSNMLMPAEVEPLAELVLHLQPTEGDWRLDSFEARMVDFSMRASIDVILAEGSTLSRAPVAVCILSSDDYLNSSPAQRREWDYWLPGGHCLNQLSFANASKSQVRIGPSRFSLNDEAPILPRSADGWRLVALNNGTEKAHPHPKISMF
jgi:hypothetical protein